MCCLHISPFVHFPRATALDTGLRGGEWRSEMGRERDFEICFIGREGCLGQRAQDGLDPGNAQL